MYKGLFITVEGVDGAGKTTHIPFLGNLLEEAGLKVVATREPGGTDLGEALREILLYHRNSPLCAETELLLMFAARMEHLRQVIVPAIQAGKCVLCDRFTDASYAYQGGGRGIDDNHIARLEEWVQNGLQPDLTLVFDVPVEVGSSRTRGRGDQADRFEQEEITFKQAVRRIYRERAQRYPERIKLVDSSHSMEHTRQVLMAHIKDFLASHDTGN